MISELKIELNNRIVSNETNVNYSHLINHLLENSKNDDLIYRNIDIILMLLNMMILIKIFS